MIPLAKSGQIKTIGVSNHNLAEIRRANEILAAEGLKFLRCKIISVCCTVLLNGLTSLITVRKTALPFIPIWYWNRERLPGGTMRRTRFRQEPGAVILIIRT